MTIWAGLNDSGDVDVALAQRFGLGKEFPDNATDADNIRLKECLEVACSQWEKRTGRLYGRVEADAEDMIVKVTSYKPEMYLPVFQNVAGFNITVSYFEGSDGYVDVESDKYSEVKLGAGRGDYDTIYNDEYWQPGTYKVNAVWGEAEAPTDVKHGAIRYATFLYSTMKNTMAEGSVLDLQSGIFIEESRIPTAIYHIMMQDKKVSKSFRRKN